MASDYGIKIVGEDGNVESILTKENINILHFFSSNPTAMIVKTAFVNGGTYSHNLGYKPFFFVFEVDSVSTPTTFSVNLGSTGASATTTQITGLPTNAYIICLVNNI